eukprot:413852-Pyramimonas_sp.AAC.1
MTQDFASVTGARVDLTAAALVVLYNFLLVFEISSNAPGSDCIKKSTCDRFRKSINISIQPKKECVRTRGVMGANKEERTVGRLPIAYHVPPLHAGIANRVGETQIISS